MVTEGWGIYARRNERKQKQQYSNRKIMREKCLFPKFLITLKRKIKNHEFK